MVYIAGRVGADRDLKIPLDARTQIVLSFENLKAASAEVGATFEDVMKINNYLLNIADLKHYREVRDMYVNTATPPAGTLVVVSRLAIDGLVFEIEAVAALPAK